MTDDFSWWQNALTGMRGPIHDGEPQSGFYRQKNRDKIYEPVAFWKDSASGEQRCHVNGKSVSIDRANQIWPFASKCPITEDAYFHRIETGQWMDDDAGAAEAAKGPAIDPAADPAGSLKAEIAAAKAGLPNYATIESDEQAAKAQTLRSTLTGFAGKATKAYEALNRPLLDEQKRIREVWFPIRDDAANGAEAIRKALGAFEDFKRDAARKAQVEADRKAAEHAEAVRKAEEANQPPPPPPAAPVAPNAPPPATKIKGASGRAASVRLKKVVTAIDIDKAFQQFREDPELYAFLIDLSQKVVDAGFVAIGATIEEKADIR